MFDFSSELFGFMNQRPRYERELKEDTVNGYHIDTCAVDDRDWNYETAIQHEQFRGGEWIVVRGYDSKEELMDNELYCPMKMTSNPLGRCVCEKEKCAWWRQLDNCCSVWWIAWKLDGIETKMKR